MAETGSESRTPDETVLKSGHCNGDAAERPALAEEKLLQGQVQMLLAQLQSLKFQRQKFESVPNRKDEYRELYNLIVNIHGKQLEMTHKEEMYRKKLALRDRLWIDKTELPEDCPILRMWFLQMKQFTSQLQEYLSEDTTELRKNDNSGSDQICYEPKESKNEETGAYEVHFGTRYKQKTLEVTISQDKTGEIQMSNSLSIPGIETPAVQQAVKDDPAVPFDVFVRTVVHPELDKFWKAGSAGDGSGSNADKKS